ncbi:hypothetical protein HN695_02020 [Candidatus Woesearchaeota archaeon]|nr:hypothetical protein [Candidatus Woesearchaeota archaeon]MBT5273175.1 hypothetical protein [Candidatus Woesearchaeota archaeon]MBT6041202.1 hypothetical protein [Candidatus Woesearchaeota archaeon]MBT6337510.1 hypothetical protein [Candidatus Woesearchaeota archaeon]MBT7927089.1 hypothetical protein [Candidatus Woesearchaeota archaeon]
MKTVFYFMATFIALVFLFSGVLSNDINLNQALHGAAIDVVEEPDPIIESSEKDLENLPEDELIVVYPYEES